MNARIPLVWLFASLGLACSKSEHAQVSGPVAALPAPPGDADSGIRAPNATSATSATARSADAADAGEKRVPVQQHEVKDGTIGAAFLEGGSPVAVRVTVLPLTVLPRDQRTFGQMIAPADDDLRRAEPPFSQVGMYRNAKRGRFLALVEARPQTPVPEADDAAFVWWFTGKAASRPLAPAVQKAVAWRIWKGAAGHRQMNPDVLAVESAGGEVLAARYLGAVSQVVPIAVDPAIPMFQVSILDSASGVDDGVTMQVTGLVEGELRSLLSIDAGPRSLITDRQVLGPPGSIASSVDGDKRGVRVRSIVQTEEEPCTPGALADPGCKGEEHIDLWDPATRTFVNGTPKNVMLRQKTAGASVTVTPR